MGSNDGKFCSFSMMDVGIKVVIVGRGKVTMSYEKAKFEFIVDTIISMFMSDYLSVVVENNVKKLKLFLSYSHPVSKGGFRYDRLCLRAAAEIEEANRKIVEARELEEKKKTEGEEEKRAKEEEKKKAKEEEKKKMEENLKKRTEEIKKQEQEMEAIKKKEAEERKKKQLEEMKRREKEQEELRRKAAEEEERKKKKELKEMKKREQEQEELRKKTA